MVLIMVPHIPALGSGGVPHVPPTILMSGGCFVNIIKRNEITKQLRHHYMPYNSPYNLILRSKVGGWGDPLLQKSTPPPIYQTFSHPLKNYSHCATIFQELISHNLRVCKTWIALEALF